MSDRFPTQLTIYECPPEQRPAALAVIAEAYLGPEWTGGGAATELVLGEQYVDYEAAGNLEAEVADALIDKAPGATFIVWADPKYEYPGELVMYTPELGRFSHTCDAQGTATFAPDEILSLVRQAITLPDPVEAVRGNLGIRWTDAIDSLNASQAEQVPA